MTPYIWKWWDASYSGPHDQWALEGQPDDEEDEEPDGEPDYEIYMEEE